MNKYQAATKISLPRAGTAKVRLLPLALRVNRAAGPDIYFSRLHEAAAVRQASFEAAVCAVQGH